MYKNVLVFPCGSEIGLEIYRSLRYEKFINLIGASTVSDHGAYIYENYLEGIRKEDIKELVKKIKIDYIFPAHDDTMCYLSKTDLPVISAGFITTDILRHKKKTYEYFESKLRVPKMNVNQYPVFLKPNAGQGSQGTHIARCFEEVDFYRLFDPTLLILEYLPGKEYTIDCFTHKGELLFVGGRERERIKSGISVRSKPVKDERFYRIAKIINSNLEMKGAWFFQVKEKDGELVLMEISNRIAGTMGLYRMRGINFPLLSLYSFMGMDVKIIDNDTKVTVDRALESVYRIDLEYDRVYVDYDDCLIIDGKLNLLLTKFIIQCVNDGIPVSLITKNKKPDSVFNQMFSEIIIAKGKKSKYIKGKAIFIDDSFAERQDVHSFGIPVFSPDAVECLIR